MQIGPDAGPHALYRVLLEGEVLQWSPAFGGAWVCGQYNHCLNLLRDVRLLSSGALPDHEPDRTLSEWMVFRDGPEHRRLRQALHSVGAAAFQDRVGRAVTTLVDRFAASGGGDFVREIAWPLPGLVVAELLGTDESGRPSLLEWTQQVADYLRERPTTPERSQTAGSALSKLCAHFRELIERRRAGPAGDLLSRVVGDHALDESELALQCAQLMFGGHETTRNLLAEGLLTLLHHKESLQALRGDPDGLIRSAFEEIARYVTPARFVARKAGEEMGYEGALILKGQNVLLCLGAANRDPARFAHPDRFDIRRTGNPHLAFGAGPHVCIGANIARTVWQTTILRLLDAFPRLDLRAEPQWALNDGINRLAHLEIG